MARVCLGGTFDPFHVGHEALLARAIKEAGPDGSVFIGVVSDTFSNAKRARNVQTFDRRKAQVQAWWSDQSGAPVLAVSELTDPFGPSATGDYDTIVVSQETRPTADKINQERARRRLAPLRVATVPFIVGNDLLPISGTRVALGLIDRRGQRTKPLEVAVGSKNPVKVEAVRRAFGRFLPGVPIVPVPCAVDTGVPDQPYGEETARGAEQRARAALEHTAGDPECEYGVGIEAGLFDDPSTGETFDVQHCVILDRLGTRSHGQGSGFAYPRHVVDEIRARGTTVKDVLGRLAGDKDIGRTQGAVGWLTRGALDRTRLSEQAVEAALVPRVRRHLYDDAATP